MTRLLFTRHLSTLLVTRAYYVYNKGEFSVFPEQLKKEDAVFVFPMTPNIVLIGELKRVNYYRSSNKIAKQINKRTIANAERFVYASKKSEVLRGYINKQPKNAIKMHQPIEEYFK